MNPIELAALIAALTVIAVMLLLYRATRQETRRREQREAAEQKAKDRAAAEWLDLRRQIHALPADFNTEEE